MGDAAARQATHKKSDILAMKFRQSDDSKISATCATQTDNIVMTKTTKVTTHDPGDVP